MNLFKVGIPWYSKEDYANIKKIMIGSENLAPTFEQWEQAANNALKTIPNSMKVILQSSNFIEWCKSAGYSPNSEGRQIFAAEEAKKSLG